jgi:hypothetical protein
MARPPESPNTTNVDDEDGNDPVIPLVGPPCPPDQQPEPLVLRPNGEVSRSLIAIQFPSMYDDRRTIDQKGSFYDEVIRYLTYRRKEDRGPGSFSVIGRVSRLFSDRMEEFRGSELDTTHLDMIMEVSTEFGYLLIFRAYMGTSIAWSV